MPQTIVKGYRKLVDEAMGKVRTLTPAEAKALHGRAGVQFVDLRDIRELQREGKVPGALHCPRGMLEFWIDPESPYHRKEFAADKTFVFFCGAGWRSALATKAAQEMGLKPVAHIDGGLKAWREAGGAFEAPPPPPAKKS